MRLEFSGIVEIHPDAERDRRGHYHPVGPTFTVGGRDVVEEVEALSRHPGLGVSQVELLIFGTFDAREDEEILRCAGYTWAHVGHAAYSEFTPGESDEFDVGGVDVILEMLKLDGQDVTIVLTVESIERPLTIAPLPYPFRLT